MKDEKGGDERGKGGREGKMIERRKKREKGEKSNGNTKEKRTGKNWGEE